MSDSTDFKEIKDIENSEGGLISKTEEEEREVTTGTKLKIIAALFVVGFAAYVAYWVQEPTELKTDVVNEVKVVATQTVTAQALPSQTIPAQTLPNQTSQPQAIPPQSYLPQAVSDTDKTNILPLAQTSAQITDAQNVTSQADSELRPAAYPSLLDSNTAYLNNSLSAKAPLANKTKAADGNKIVNSGPEVFIYMGIFVAILFFTRKKLLESVTK